MIVNDVKFKGTLWKEFDDFTILLSKWNRLISERTYNDENDVRFWPNPSKTFAMRENQGIHAVSFEMGAWMIPNCHIHYPARKCTSILRKEREWLIPSLWRCSPSFFLASPFVSSWRRTISYRSVMWIQGSWKFVILLKRKGRTILSINRNSFQSLRFSHVYYSTIVMDKR